MINESYLGFGFVNTVSLAHKLLSNFIPSEEQLLGQRSVYAITLSSKRHLEETLDFSESEIAKILANPACAILPFFRTGKISTATCYLFSVMSFCLLLVNWLNTQILIRVNTREGPNIIQLCFMWRMEFLISISALNFWHSKVELISFFLVKFFQNDSWLMHLLTRKNNINNQLFRQLSNMIL